jgi:hypothetical protein
MTEAAITSVTLDSLRDVLQQAGYRVETFMDPAGVSHLRSATAGLPFDLRLGTLLNDGSGYGDVALVTGLQIQGELPLALINQWNRTRRFGRLHVDQNVLVLVMDVLVALGVTPSHLRAQIEIWDRLVQELVPFLRAEVGRLAVNGQAGAIANAPSEQPAATAA